MTSRRQRRVSELLQEEVSLIALELDDPRLSYVTVTDVEVSPDLRHAHVFVNDSGGAEDKASVLTALEHAKGFIRHELADRGVMRFVPDLTFRWDASVDQGQRIDELLKELE
jgi:ribosome-binding factor A